MRDAQLEPDYVYEEAPPEVAEMQCPEKSYIACEEWMDRGEMFKHYMAYHVDTHGLTTMEEIENLFENERDRRFSR